MVCPCFAAFEGLTMSPEEIIFDSGGFNSNTDQFSVELSRSWKFGLPELAVNRLQIEYFGKLLPIHTVWQSSGDQVYRENRIIFGTGISYKNCCLLYKGSMYNLIISNYGSDTSFGSDFHVSWEPISKYRFSAGSDGLIAKNFINRKIWGKAFYRITDQCDMSILIETFRRGEPNYGLGYHWDMNPTCGFELFFSENPQLYGLNILLALPCFSVISGVSLQSHLGWSQKLGASYSW
jgi:hypothetical protein